MTRGNPVRNFVIATIGLLLSNPLLAAPPDDPQWPHEAECKKWTDVAVPARDIGSAAQHCDAQALYDNRDFAAARQCAYRERDSGVLMMLYANGEGVARNIPLAKRFACEFDGAPAEVSGRLEHLDAIASGKDRKPMDICDDITSGMMMGFCAAHEGDAARAKRETRWTSLQSSWTPAQRSALADMRKVAKAYFESVSREETDMSGTARGALAEAAYENLDKALLTDVEHFERGKFPATRAQDFAGADRALNATYKKVLARLANSEGPYGTVTPDGVRTTQRLWLGYRDAWARFAAARYPAVGADAWRAWLTRDRTGALLEIISD
ncbi:MAG: DUF1311 domain-containing protein [Xanthomonadales bacterium]|nr:DUF1311 domain-containing protein [Xanthomonadales bacterium]